MFEAIIAGLKATSALEAVSVVLGLAYLLMVVWRSRWGWVAGGISSAILGYLAIRARLPMQAALQVYYVGMSVYGFWHWTKQDASKPVTVTTWPLKYHIIACAGILLASAVSAEFLAGQTHAAWPFLDSFTTWGSLFTTWLVARAKLENWLYWIVVDSLLAYLFAMQELYFVALLTVVYVGIVIGGYFKWLRLYRTSTVTS
jgi:nicotinamide mononucleotide transporter